MDGTELTRSSGRLAMKRAEKAISGEGMHGVWPGQWWVNVLTG